MRKTFCLVLFSFLTLIGLQAKVFVISDIDDTIKRAGVPLPEKEDLSRNERYVH